MRYNFILIILITLSFTSCGVILQTEEIKEYKIDKEFNGYLSKFKEYQIEMGGSGRIDNLIMRFNSSVRYPTLGTCTEQYQETIEFLKRKIYKTPIIDINPEAWSYMSASEKETLIFHELGHCILNRGHDNSSIYDGGYSSYIPSSIMHEYAISSTFYESRYDHYIKELFGQENDSVAYFEYNPNVYALKHKKEELDYEVLVAEGEQSGENGKDECVHSKESIIIKEI